MGKYKVIEGAVFEKVNGKKVFCGYLNEKSLEEFVEIKESLEKKFKGFFEEDET